LNSKNVPAVYIDPVEMNTRDSKTATAFIPITQIMIRKADY